MITKNFRATLGSLQQSDEGITIGGITELKNWLSAAHHEAIIFLDPPLFSRHNS